MKLLHIILQTDKIIKLLTVASEAIKNIFGYLFMKQNNIKVKIQDKKQSQFNKKAKDVIDSGTIEDLLDLRKV